MQVYLSTGKPGQELLEVDPPLHNALYVRILKHVWSQFMEQLGVYILCMALKLIV